MDQENGSTTFLRGKELLQYILENCEQKMELWIVWTDHDGNIEVVNHNLTELTEEYLRTLYEDNDQGILTSRRVILER